VNWYFLYILVGQLEGDWQTTITNQSPKRNAAREPHHSVLQYCDSKLFVTLLTSVENTNEPKQWAKQLENYWQLPTLLAGCMYLLYIKFQIFFFCFFIMVYLTAKTVPMLLLTSVSLFLCHKVCDNKIIIRKLKQRHFRYKYKCDSVKQLKHFWWPAVA